MKKTKRIFARIQAKQLEQVHGGMKNGCGGGGHVATESFSGGGDNLTCGGSGTMDDSDYQ